MGEDKRKVMVAGQTLFKSLLLALTLVQASAGAAVGSELKVTLFGQPCVMSGPVSADELRDIHAISPERTVEFETLDEGRKALERVRAAKAVPPGLETYRDRMTRRLEAKLAFLEGVELARKEGKATAMLAPTRRHLSESASKAFEAKLKAMEAKGRVELGNPDSIEGLKLWYEENIASDPEEEFHRATQRMKVSYSCPLEEQSGE